MYYVDNVVCATHHKVVKMDNRKYNFIITDHARERFVERFSKESKNFIHLSHCNGCELCRELTFKLYETVTQNRLMWNSIITIKVHDAKEVRIFHNNTTFMDEMYRKYGYSRYRFMVESEIIFVVREVDRNILQTCMSANNPVNGSRIITDFIHRPKYNKRVGNVECSSP